MSRLILSFIVFIVVLSCNNKTKEQIRSENFPPENLDYKKFEDFIEKPITFYFNQRKLFYEFNQNRFKNTKEYFLIFDSLKKHEIYWKEKLNAYSYYEYFTDSLIVFNNDLTKAINCTYILSHDSLNENSQTNTIDVSLYELQNGRWINFKKRGVNVWKLGHLNISHSKEQIEILGMKNVYSKLLTWNAKSKKWDINEEMFKRDF